MYVDVRAIGFGLTTAIDRHVQRQVDRVLGPFARRVVRVTMRLQDINAGRGGVDKRCSVVVALRRRVVIVAESTHEDLYAAVDEVASRLRSLMKRATKRHLHRERKDARRPGSLVAM